MMNRKTISRLLRVMAPYRFQYGTVCLFGVIVAMLEMIPPYLVGRTVDAVRVGKAGAFLIASIAAGWLLVAAISEALHHFQISLAGKSGERILSKLRFEIFARLQRLPIAYFDRTHVGRILSAHSNDLDATRNALIWGLNTLLSSTTIMVLASAMIYVTDSRLFFAVAWLAPVMTIASFFYGDVVGRAWKGVRHHSMRVQSHQVESIAGARVVYAFNRQEESVKRYDALQRLNTRANVRAASLGGAFQPLLQGIRFLGQAIIWIYGGYCVAHGKLAAGKLVTVSLYWEWFMQPAMNFGSLFNDILIAASGAERVFALLDEPTQRDRPAKAGPDAVRGHVRVDGVSFGYAANRPVLSEVGLDAPAGTVTALVGESGCGKTTLLSLLARFYEPTSGRITIDGTDVQSLSEAEYRRWVTVVPQSDFLFSGTIMDNLRYARPEATDEEVHEAARTLGCHEKILGLPNGYQTVVSNFGSSLSAGEQQLVCFTRALLSRARILLLDEATSSMDMETEIQVQDALGKLASRQTTFIVAHRPTTIVQADQIVVMDQGRIVERGAHDELLARNGVYARRLQALESLESLENPESSEAGPQADLAAV